MKSSTQMLSLLCAGLLATSFLSAKPEGGPEGERPNPEARFAQQDSNGDGFLSLDEIKASRKDKMAEHFDKLDTNGDGLLSKEELKAGHQKIKERRGDDDKGPRGEGDRPDPKKMFERMDADQSGGLSRNEVKGRMAKAFDKIDADSSGEITPEELKAFHETMREKRKEGKLDD